MSKFSFGKILMGLTCGVTIPFVVHDNVYYAIATCFLSPHLKYTREFKQRNPDKAIPVESLDAYLLDIGKSFIFFWLIIGPTLYKTYYLNEDMLAMGGDPRQNEEISTKRDTFADILKKMKSAEQTQAESAKAAASSDQEGV